MISPIRSPEEDNSVPPLRDGDYLTIEEFERRWEAMPHLKHAELIEGRVYMNAAALRWDWHAEPHSFVMLVTATYAALTPGVRSGAEPSVHIDTSNISQPDAVLRITEECGGRVKLEKGYVVGSPEFVAEISGSTERHDLSVKKALYLRSKVGEYLNWSVLEERIVLFVLCDGEYVEQSVDAAGILKSRILPGLWFDPSALVRGDGARVLEVLHLGLQSAEHQAFVQELKNRRAQAGGTP